MANITNKVFETKYKKLNKDQKEAVDTIDGPVMVVAGPGTGKTEILTLRIAKILKNANAEVDEILCLTFTNSGVRAMQERLEEYIGSNASNVRIATFHSFALELIEKHYELLDFKQNPKLLGDDEAVFLVDDILQNNDWQHIRPRANPVMYFSDLKQLISILKREGLTPEEFLVFTNQEIDNLKNDENSISTRGESKGKLKKEIEKKIESLERTLEVVEFYRIYEEKKIEKGLIDYDDVLKFVVVLVKDYEDVRADIKEKYQYVLVDEHQDSSGVQNNFLKAVWKGVEKPNIFVVGDDRQLIYGFSGAKLSYFKEFADFFGKAQLIILKENYRSSQKILDLADDLLKSSITKEKLHSNTKSGDKVLLNEYAYLRDEIIGAGLFFKAKINSGVDPKECALLVPKNYNVRTALSILRSMGIKVSSGKNVSLFDLKETEIFTRVLSIINTPSDSTALSASLLEKYSGVETFYAHKFLKSIKADKLQIEDLVSFGEGDGLFKKENSIYLWGDILKRWINTLINERLSFIISTIGNELLIDRSKDHEELLRNVEVVRTFIHLAILFEQQEKNAKLSDFLAYIKRLESYSTQISLATFGSKSGVQVMTLHKSKGMEYKIVWVAHMNEETLMSEKKNGFSLPEKIKNHLSERDVETAKRELYVAITRAKDQCVISYAGTSYGGNDMKLAQIIKDLPEQHFIKKDKNETEEELLSHGPQIYTKIELKEEGNIIEDIKTFVKENYSDTKVTVTLLNNFFECPWKWYFRNFLKLPEVKSTSLGLGSAVHSTIEFILKSQSLPNKKEIQEKIIYELEREGVSQDKVLKKLAGDGLVAVMYFVENYYKNLEKDYIAERPLSFRDPKFPNLLMYGKLDLTERSSGGQVTVTDFKTGNSKTKGVIEKKDDEGRLSTFLRQLAMYSYLIMGTEKGSKVDSCRLLFLEASATDNNALYSTNITEEQVGMLLDDIFDYEKFLQSGEWTKRSCNYNSYGKNTECEYCKMAKIYTDI